MFPVKPRLPFARLKTTELEELIIACEARVRELEIRFADPEVFRNASKLREIQAGLVAAKSELSELEAEYATRGQ